MRSCRFLATFFLSLGLALPVTALGQDDGVELEEILVTARKVGESIQDIPLSITAFGSEEIQARQIVNIEDIINFTPGLHVSNVYGDRQVNALIFRGMDPPTNERQVQLSSSFIDGIYIAGSPHMVSMNDIERVEVVKGPQSAFFGRATFGGAVNYITKTPGNEWRGDVELILGDNSRADLSGSIEGPIIEDKLTFRVTGRAYTYDGGWDNGFPTGDDLGAQETQAISLTLYATPTDNVTIKFRSLYSEDHDGAGVSFLTDDSINNCGPFWDPADPNNDPDLPAVARDYYCGTITRDLFPSEQVVDTSVNVGAPGTSWPKDDFGVERFVNINSLDISVDIGDYTVSSTTGYYTETNRNMWHFLPRELFAYSQWRDKSFSEELRLTSPQDQRLRLDGWLVLSGSYLR